MVKQHIIEYKINFKEWWTILFYEKKDVNPKRWLNKNISYENGYFKNL